MIDFGSSPEPTLTTVAVDHTVTAVGGNYGHGRHRAQAEYSSSSPAATSTWWMVRLLCRLPYEGGDEIDRCCVHRMDFSTLRWCNVRDLGGRAFLLSRFYFGASCSAGGEHGLLPDRTCLLRV